MHIISLAGNNSLIFAMRHLWYCRMFNFINIQLYIRKYNDFGNMFSLISQYDFCGQNRSFGHADNEGGDDYRQVGPLLKQTKQRNSKVFEHPSHRTW